MSIEIGAGLALLGIIFGWGASWASMGKDIKGLEKSLVSLKDSMEHALSINDRNHTALLEKMEEIGRISVRVAVLETKVFGRPYPVPNQETNGLS